MEEIIEIDNCALTELLGYFKQHLRITSNDADADLMAKLRSALTSVGNDINRIMGSSVVTATAKVSSTAGEIRLTLRGPVRGLVAIYVDDEPVDESLYSISGNRLRIAGDYIDVIVKVVYRAGYETIPADLWDAVCLRGAGSYANPLDSIQERRRASDVLIRAYRFRDWIS